MMDGDNPNAMSIFSLLSLAYGHDSQATRWNHRGYHHFPPIGLGMPA